MKSEGKRKEGKGRATVLQLSGLFQTAGETVWPMLCTGLCRGQNQMTDAVIL